MKVASAIRVVVFRVTRIVITASLWSLVGLAIGFLVEYPLVLLYEASLPPYEQADFDALRWSFLGRFSSFGWAVGLMYGFLRTWELGRVVLVDDEEEDAV